MRNRVKKYVSFVLSLMLLFVFMFGCSNSKYLGDTPECEYVPPEKLRHLIETAERGEYASEAHSSVIDASCPNFETYLENCTNIIKATYLESYQINRDDYLHRFKIIQNIRGEDIPPEIFVTAYGINYDGHSTMDIRYEVGKGYLLLLKCLEGPFDEGYGCTYTNVTEYSDVVIPLTEDGQPDINNSLYCKADLSSFIGDEKLKKSIDKGEFLEELLVRVKNNPYIFKGISGNFIGSNDVEIIAKNTPCIFIIKLDGVDYEIYTSNDFRSYRCFCTVQKIYKGSEEFAQKKIVLRLPAQLIDESHLGDKFVVLLNPIDRKLGYLYDFELSSTKSVYNYSTSEELEDILKMIGYKETN